MNIQSPIIPPVSGNTQHMAPKWPAFDWQDPMLLDGQLTDEERIIRDAARGFCDETLMPGVKLANRHETFDNLFPTNHKFYGYMDFFSLQNLHDVRFIVTAKPTPRLSLALEGHLFWLADDRDSLYAVNGTPRGGLVSTPGTGYGLNSGYSKFVGGEIDLIAGYALTKNASLEAGFGHFFTGGYLQSTFRTAANQGATDANWFYLQTTMTF